MLGYNLITTYAGHSYAFDVKLEILKKVVSYEIERNFTNYSFQLYDSKINFK